MYKQIGVCEPLGEDGDADVAIDHEAKIVWYSQSLDAEGVILALEVANERIADHLAIRPVTLSPVPLVSSTEA